MTSSVSKLYPYQAIAVAAMRNGVGTLQQPVRTHPIVWTGRDYGYPECCIEAFTNFLRTGERGTCVSDAQFPPELFGTGFVPCQHCVDTKTPEQLVYEINARRTDPVPFQAKTNVGFHAEVIL